MSRERTNNTQTSRISFRDLQVKVEDLRQKRDELNQKTKDYINDLQELETEITTSLKIAKEKHKKKRDYWNNKVKLLKEKKVEYKKLLDNLMEEKKKHKGSKQETTNNQKTLSMKQIERKIDSLERIIETEKLEITEENAIIDKIRIFAEMKHNYLSEERNSVLFKIEKKIEIIKVNLNKIYEQLGKWSNKSQENHTKMLEMFQRVDELKEDKKRIEEELIENKKTADRYHEQYLKIINQRKKKYKSKKPYTSGKHIGTKRNQKTHKSALIAKIQEDKLAMALEKHKAGKKLNLFEARLILEKSKEQN